MSAVKEASVAAAPRKRLSCTAYFDVLMFCYCRRSNLDPEIFEEIFGSSEEENEFGLIIGCGKDMLAPVHQMQQYYRAGQLDNCSGKWSGLVNCLTLKTKRASEIEEILEAREKEKSHIWSFRTPKEAASNWEEMFGHLDEVE
ncbi:hypothetical protein AgCh_034688 [Apium graveolens]